MTRNDAERAFLRLCAEHAIPTPQSNVMVDAGETHDTQRAFREDRRRDRVLTVRGVQVLRVTWWDLVEDAAGLAGTLRQVLLARC